MSHGTRLRFYGPDSTEFRGGMADFVKDVSLSRQFPKGGNHWNPGGRKADPTRSDATRNYFSRSSEEDSPEHTHLADPIGRQHVRGLPCIVPHIWVKRWKKETFEKENFLDFDKKSFEKHLLNCLFGSFQSLW